MNGWTRWTIDVCFRSRGGVERGRERDKSSGVVMAVVEIAAEAVVTGVAVAVVA